ncbi:MAG: hypothetical protein H0U69_04650 [Trueperaceae bacterium]|nr:hypothetical protein [Trueperaceae bacterium]
MKPDALGIVLTPIATADVSRSQTSAQPNMVVVAVLAVAALGLVLGGHVALDRGWFTVDYAVPFMLRGFAAALALGIGFVNLARYVGRRDASSLIVGVAFTGVGLLFVLRIVLHALAVTVDLGYFDTSFRVLWAHQMYLPVALLMGIALVPPSPTAASSRLPATPERTRRSVSVFVAVAALLVLGAIVGAWSPVFPGGTIADTIVARPAAGWLVSAYLIVLVLIGRRSDLASTTEGPWLFLALFIGLLQAALVAPFWHTVDVAAAVLDGATNLMMFLAAAMGTLVGMVRQARDEDSLFEALRVESRERARIEGALAREAARLEQANDELAQYAYLASHDLQEPLRMVTNYLQLIERRYAHLLDDDGREFMAFAVDGGVRMKRLTNDLLTYSKVNARPPVLTHIDAEAALRAARSNLSLAVAESGAQITNDPLPHVPIDHVRLVQVFENLVANALKFRRTDVPPRVHVAAARQGDMWRFTVSDNGIGIESAHFDKVFGVFQRLHRPDAYPGSGIGLAICRKIVERHGGAIWIESTLGVGTAVHWTVPTDPAGVYAARPPLPDEGEIDERVSTLIERARALL